MKFEKKTVIFDLDGIICFTDRFHYQAWKALANRLGITSLPGIRTSWTNTATG